MSHKGEMKSWAKYLRYYKFLGFSARGEIPTVWVGVIEFDHFLWCHDEIRILTWSWSWLFRLCFTDVRRPAENPRIADTRLSRHFEGAYPTVSFWKVSFLCVTKFDKISQTMQNYMVKVVSFRDDIYYFQTLCIIQSNPHEKWLIV